MENRAQQWITRLGMQEHPEGGWFREVYHAPAEYGASRDGRPLAGSIYFLLNEGEISHFHVIDCDEIWYAHEGCGVEIFLWGPEREEQNAPQQETETKPQGQKTETASDAGACSLRREVLGCGEGMAPMVILPKGAVFGARNLDPAGYTLMSCATIPAFHYEGFRLVPQEELLRQHPEEAELIRQMAFA